MSNSVLLIHPMMILTAQISKLWMQILLNRKKQLRRWTKHGDSRRQGFMVAIKKMMTNQTPVTTLMSWSRPSDLQVLGLERWRSICKKRRKTLPKHKMKKLEVDKQPKRAQEMMRNLTLTINRRMEPRRLATNCSPRKNRLIYGVKSHPKTYVNLLRIWTHSS